MVVLDASFTVAYLADHPLDHAVAVHTRLMGEVSLHAPHLLDVEVTNTLRRLVLHRELSVQRAQRVLNDLLELPITRYPHYRLLPRVWELRHNLTAYDALYVSLAEALGMPLLTLDAAIQQAPGHRAHVEVL